MSVPTNRTHAAADRSNLYDEITGKIIAELEAGRFPWVQPWGTSAANASLCLPQNASTHRPYSGINVLMRLISAAGSILATARKQSWSTSRPSQPIPFRHVSPALSIRRLACNTSC
jgi:antirestriction protein ArdC